MLTFFNAQFMFNFLCGLKNIHLHLICLNHNPNRSTPYIWLIFLLSLFILQQPHPLWLMLLLCCGRNWSFTL